jgi:glycosyltransferase involved in cell wall biosynthesis
MESWLCQIPGVTGTNEDIAPCLSVVMPAFNEERTIGRIIATVLAQRPVQELIVVDDGSSDKTAAIVESLKSSDVRLSLHRHERNRGKGAALRTGFHHASAPFVMVQDADLEYEPAEYHLLLKPLLAGKADAVFSSRFLGAGAHRVLYFWHYAGNRLLTTLLNVSINLNLTDMEAGPKAFRREVLGRISLKENRFGFEPEIAARMARLRARIYEVAVSYDGRTYAEGKKINWRDGVSALRCIVKYGLLGL